ncbi:MAG: class I SAM-dependent RNA methyltransferase, partial [Brevibacterium sp.]|nr:class I SAM-dependent RNA methyltransferase [Brevibacterium sp.]
TGAGLYGVEGAKSAIENAKANAKGFNANFDASRADRVRIPKSDVIILDPPRSGAGKAVTRALIESSATTIVYVSCDAATLARDLATLVDAGFAIERLRGFDLFPLTAHVETVTVLRR